MSCVKSLSSVAILGALLLSNNAAMAGDASKGSVGGIVVGSDRYDGRLLLAELNCAACHVGDATGDAVQPKRAPLLADVGKRVTPQFLRAFLSDPQKAKAGTAMPDLLHGLPAADRESTVDRLVHYLVSLGGPIETTGPRVSPADIHAGQELYHKVGCVACHASFVPPPKQKANPAAVDDDEEKFAKPEPPFESPSVSHGDLATKATVAALADFLTDPLKVRPSGRMPSLHLQPNEASQIAAYLLRDQHPGPDKSPRPGLAFTFFEQGKWTPQPISLGLAAGRGVEGEVGSFDFAAMLEKTGKKAKGAAFRFQGEIDVPKTGSYKFNLKSRTALLRVDGKSVVANETPNPQEKTGFVELTKGWHSIDAAFIAADDKAAEFGVWWTPPGAKAKEPIPPTALRMSVAPMVPKGAADFALDPIKAEAGEKLFRSLGCASCHSVKSDGGLDALAKLKAPALSKANPAAGCLAAKVGKGQPRFAFDDKQRAALAQELAAEQPEKAKTRIEVTLASMNCRACHIRGARGGPDKQRSAYFAYGIPVDLGDEGRLPPTLTGVGAKLTTQGFEDALFSGKPYRSAMATRMPNFGKGNVGHLPALFDQADAGAIAAHQPSSSSKMIDDGRLLAGKNTLACINCHAWGKSRLSGAEGLDLLEVGRRIKPEWFHAFLLDPNKIRPGTRMPTAWPDGKSFFPNVQNGSVDKQIDSIWAYLKTGDIAGAPPGLLAADNALLVPVGQPILFRTFAEKVGAHAILVGFPQRIHVAFDANRVRMVTAWTGDFINTKPAWDGRAGRYVKIPGISEAPFPDGPPFAQLESTTADWPKDVPKKTVGATRTPSGWRFLGYRYADNGVPTFLYDIGLAKVAETPSVEQRPDGTYLLRKFVVTADKDAPDLYLRVAVGAIVEKNGAFIVDGHYRLRVVAGNGMTPTLRNSGKFQELLVPIRFGAPKDNVREATVVVESIW